VLGLSYASSLSPRLESELVTLFTPSPSRVGHPGDPYNREMTLFFNYLDKGSIAWNCVISTSHVSCLTTFWSPNHSSHFPSESNYQSIYKKLKQLKPFLTKIGPAIPLTEARLVSPKSLTKERGRLVSSMFPTKILILFTPAIFYTHLLYPHITFL